MKKFIVISILGLLSPLAQGQNNQGSVRGKISAVNSAVFTRTNSGTVLKVNYSSGGCSPKANDPKIELEYVSMKDVTPQWALSDPKIIHEYDVVVNAIVTEARKAVMCAMAYDLNVTANVTELFQKNASSFGIDLASKKAHYGVNFNAPSVQGRTFFSAYDK